MSRWRDPQLQVSENMQIWQDEGQVFSNRAEWCHIMALTCLKGGTECGNNWVEMRINSAPAVKGLIRFIMQSMYVITNGMSNIFRCLTSN